MRALILVLLGGCLYISHDGGDTSSQLGIEYRCTFRLNSVDRDENVCGPAVQDPDYVIAHLPWKNASQITCTATANPCIFVPDKSGEPTE